MSVEISIQDWNEVDLDELVNLTFKAWRSTPLWPEGRTLEMFRDYVLQMKERFSPSFLILARSGGDLVGWLCVITEDPSMYDIWRWHPVVLPGRNEEEIGVKLIGASLEKMKREGVDYAEVCFDLGQERLSPEGEHKYKKTSGWYQQNGFRLMDETAYMICRSDEFKPFQQSSLDQGYEIREYREEDREALFDCFTTSFLESQDRSFHEKSEDQRVAMFKKYVDDADLNQAGTLLLLKDGKIVGFTVFNIRPAIGDEHLGFIGIHPDHRGRSLGKHLLSNAMIEIAKQGDKVFSLGVDLVNQAAYRLYQDLGFTTQTKLITHYWKGE